MTTALTIIGPQDQGRRMSLAEFEHAEAKEGHSYELGKGVIIVTDVPNRSHLAQLNAVRRQLNAYDLANPGAIDSIAGGAECKILIGNDESERHPDLAVYRTAPPEGGAEIWWSWVPEIVIEIVSPGSEQRDYEEKPGEYLAFGVQEYWIFDAARQTATIHQRRGGSWATRTATIDDTHRTHVLPGFELQIGAVLKAGRA